MFYFVLCAVVLMERANPATCYSDTGSEWLVGDGLKSSTGHSRPKRHEAANGSCPEGDIVILLNNSERKSEFWNYTLSFAQGLIRSLTSLNSNVRFGVATYSDHYRLYFHLTPYRYTYWTKYPDVGKLPMKGRDNNTAAAIRFMYREMFTEENGGRRTAPNVGIVITHGQSDDMDQAIQEANTARDNGILMFAVTFGDNNEEELDAVANKPSEKFVFKPEFELLLTSDLNRTVTELSSTVCETVAAGCPKRIEQQIWDSAQIGYLATSNVFCLKEGQLLPKYTRRCQWGNNTATWGEVGEEENCTKLSSKSAVTSDLIQLSQVVITGTKALKTASKLNNLTNQPSILTYTDIALCAQILEKLTAVDGIDVEVGNSIVETVDNLMDADAASLASAERLNGSSKRIMLLLERLTLPADPEAECAPRSDDIHLCLSDAFENCHQYRTGHMCPPFDEMKLLYETTNETHLRVFGYDKPSLFLTPERLQYPYGDTYIYHTVMGIKLRGFPSRGLPSAPVRIYFHKNQINVTYTCVFWDFSAAFGRGNWSTEGCYLMSEDYFIECNFHHLTGYFALLVRLQNTGSTGFPGDVSGSPKSLWIKATVGSCAAAGVLLVLGVCVYKYRRRGRPRFGRILFQKETGDLDLKIVTSTKFKLRSLVGSTFDDDMLLKLDQLEMPRNCITLTEQIGKGAFGTVWKAVYRNMGKRRIVAVKSVLGSNETEDVVPVLTEALVMGQLRHRHVLGLLGIALDDELNLPLLVLPFMRHGDLNSYLRSCRSGECADVKPPEPHQLLVFGQHIARGMEYLAGQQIVHRDLASRNCMVGASMVVRVADFGLAKDVCEKTYYRQAREARLPIKWLAMESFEDRVFTSKSDVWAYGVTLWEIYTMGRTPYPALNNTQTMEYVENGGRLKQPAECPDQIFSLMKECWKERPSDRPTFSELVEKINEYLAFIMGYLEVSDQVFTESLDGVLYYNVQANVSSDNDEDDGEEHSDDGDDNVDDDTNYLASMTTRNVEMEQMTPTETLA